MDTSHWALRQGDACALCALCALCAPLLFCQRTIAELVVTFGVSAKMHQPGVGVWVCLGVAWSAGRGEAFRHTDRRFVIHIRRLRAGWRGVLCALFPTFCDCMDATIICAPDAH